MFYFSDTDRHDHGGRFLDCRRNGGFFDPSRCFRLSVGLLPTPRRSQRCLLSEARRHYWNLLLGYFLSHFVAIGFIFLQVFFMNIILDNQLWSQGFGIFETFVESPVTRNDSLALLFPYTIKVVYYIIITICR